VTALLALAACSPGPPPPLRRPPADVAALDRAVRAALDPTADPCADFHQFACGGWLAAVPPPTDRPQIMRSLTSIEARNRMLLVQVLERETDAPWHRRASTFYDACMDVAAVEATGLQPLAPWMAEIDAAGDLAAVFAAAARLRRAGASPLWTLGVERDPLEPTRHVLLLAPGGIGVPDPRLLLDEERGLASAYRAHVGRMLELTGLRPPRARTQARGVLELETALARAAVEAAGAGSAGSTPKGVVASGEGAAGAGAVRGRAALAALDPALPWDAYFAALGAPDLDALEVSSPGFVRAAGVALRAASIETLRAYLRWQLLHALAEQLPRAYDEEDFAFASQLTGAVAMPPRPDRCAAATLAALPDETSRAWTAVAFAGENRAVAEAMVDGIAAAFEASLPGVAWMDDATRAAAAAKARSLGRKVGHPDPWPASASFPVEPARYLANALAAADARVRRELAAAGAPVDPAAWPVAPIAMRAFYDPRGNQLVAPAGLLQPPVFDATLPAPMRWGAAGAMLGHEWTHGFDAQGRLFDAAGRLAPWWSDETTRRFTDASQCLVDHYGRFEVEPGLPVDGRRTFAENAADVGGLALAHRAWRAEAGRDATAPSAIGGFSQEQLFFVAYAQMWCARAQPAYDAAMARTDPRARPRFRIRGPVSQIPAFQEAFSCPPTPTCPLW
jgi:predicted metalloendopeptidase